ncbi:MAG: phenylalanyl-tRNA synthetase subunit alpha [Parcubacteria group bacterium Gr01-1014_107]|nr:MAG: phenylalanyl-tRNA synthetase subunit alpha [Parcubacteria group bacterium Gr01-1014_107]
MSEDQGHLHPITAFIYRACEIFSELGFQIVQGPEIEEEKYNFDWLNIPPDHPARGMQDTFWLKPEKNGKLLRTHTTAVDARFLEKKMFIWAT